MKTLLNWGEGIRESDRKPKRTCGLRPVNADASLTWVRVPAPHCNTGARGDLGGERTRIDVEKAKRRVEKIKPEHN